MPTPAQLGIDTADISLSSAADISIVMNALNAIIGDMTVSGIGPLSGRPVSTSGTPGIERRIYIVTDQVGGPRLDVDTGTSWVTIGPSIVADNTIATSMLQDGSVTESKLENGAVDTTKLAVAAVTAAILAAGSVDGSKIAASLLPSSGASAATEALRALGTAGGQALPGNDVSVTNARTPTAHATSHQPAGSDPIPELAWADAGYGGLIQQGFEGNDGVITISISAGGAVTLNVTNNSTGHAWVKSASGLLTRVAVPAGSNISYTWDAGTPFPNANTYSSYAFELDTAGVWHMNQRGTPNQATAAAAVTQALAAPAVAGRTRAFAYVMFNNAGVYSLSGSVIDRRPAARGVQGYRGQTDTAVIGTTWAFNQTPLFQNGLRLEVQSGWVEVQWVFPFLAGGSSIGGVYELLGGIVLNGGAAVYNSTWQSNIGGGAPSIFGVILGGPKPLNCGVGSQLLNASVTLQQDPSGGSFAWQQGLSMRVREIPAPLDNGTV